MFFTLSNLHAAAKSQNEFSYSWYLSVFTTVFGSSMREIVCRFSLRLNSAVKAISNEWYIFFIIIVVVVSHCCQIIFIVTFITWQESSSGNSVGVLRKLQQIRTRTKTVRFLEGHKTHSWRLILCWTTKRKLSAFLITPILRRLHFFTSPLDDTCKRFTLPRMTRQEWNRGRQDGRQRQTPVVW